MICQIIITIAAFGQPGPKITNPPNCDTRLPEYPSPIVCTVTTTGGLRIQCADKCGHPIYHYLRLRSGKVVILYESPSTCNEG